MQHRVSHVLRFVSLTGFLTLFGAGCFGTTAPAAVDGGVWITKDHGQTWVNKRALVNGASVTAGAANLSVLDMTYDPQEPSVMYLATRENGLLVSYNGGDSWQGMTKFNAVRVNGVAVDPKNKCAVSATTRNEVWKTTNCGRDWSRLFFDPRTDKSFTKIVLDWYNPLNVYAGTSDGDVFKSTDGGVSWLRSVRAEGNSITSIQMDPKDSRIVYVGTNGDGVYKTVDAGATWTQIKKQFPDEYSDARRVTQLVLDPNQANMVYLVSRAGILRSTDGGDTWKALNLTAPSGSITINALAIDPLNSQKLVYTGPTTISYSNDGGVTWTAKKLPTSRYGSTLLIDPKDGSNTIYLGTLPKPQN